MARERTAVQKELDGKLLHAAKQGNLVRVRTLIEAGADKDARGEYGMTPLHNAAWKGHVEVVGTLLRVGADIEAKNMAGKAPLHHAADYARVEVVGALLAGGADSSAKDKGGITPLHMSAFRGDVEVVGTLLAAGADKDAKDKEGWTPLHIAALEEHAEVARALLAAGADIFAKENNGRTALQNAVERDKTKVVDMLRKQEIGQEATEATVLSELLKKVHGEFDLGAKAAKIVAEQAELAAKKAGLREVVKQAGGGVGFADSDEEPQSSIVSNSIKTGSTRSIKVVAASEGEGSSALENPSYRAEDDPASASYRGGAVAVTSAGGVGISESKTGESGLEVLGAAESAE